MSASEEVASERHTFLKEKITKRPQGGNFVYIFSAVKAGLLRELEIQQIRQITRTSFGLQRLCNADIPVRDKFNDLFVEHKCSLSYINAAAYIQTLVSIVDNKRGGSSVPFSRSSIFVTFLFFSDNLKYGDAVEQEATGSCRRQDFNANCIHFADNVQSLK